MFSSGTGEEDDLRGYQWIWVYLEKQLINKVVVLVHGQVTIIFVVSVCLSVCLFVCAEFFSAVFDPIWIKLGHMLHVRV